MSTLTFPDIKPDSATWSITYNSKAFTSDLNNATQTAELPGAQWKANLTFTNRDGDDARKLRAFLVSLKGISGRFYLTPEDAAPRGTAAGSGLVNGASQAGSSLVTDGWIAGQPLLLAAGDYFEVNGELKMITADVASDASGNATLSFDPPLRQSPADNAQIITVNPACTMKLTGNDQSQWALTSPAFYAITIGCEEALDV